MKKVEPYFIINGLKKDLDFARKLIAIAGWLGFILGLFSGKYIIWTRYQLVLTLDIVKFREVKGETNGYWIIIPFLPCSSR